MTRALSPLARALLAQIESNCPAADRSQACCCKAVVLHDQAAAFREIAPILRLEGAAEVFESLAAKCERLYDERKAFEKQAHTVGVAGARASFAMAALHEGDTYRAKAAELRAQAEALRGEEK